MNSSTNAPPGPTGGEGETPEPMARLEALAPDDYRAARAQIFPSNDSFRWFCRQNRSELVSSGALISPTGRNLVQPDAFDRVVLAVGMRRARKG